MIDLATRTLEPKAALLGVAGVALDVRDLDRCARFYQEAIGLQRIGATPQTVLLGAGGSGFFELRHRPELRPGDPAAAGLYHTAFLLPSRADLGRWLRHAAETGLALDGAADHLVSEAVYLHDPEGNGIEIYADRPRSTWRWDDGQIAMVNARLDMIGLRALAGERWNGAPAGTIIGHVHLQVGDIPAARRFYADALGLDVVRAMPQALFMSTGGYHHHIATNVWQSAGAPKRDLGRAGLAEVVMRAAEGGGTLADPWGTSIRIVSTDTGIFA